jgi:parallel beta-helix repeat protein
MKKIVLLAFVLVLLSTATGVVFIKPVVSDPAEPVHNLDTGINYTTIQEAINADETIDGHAISVDAGIYYENVVVNKSVSLIGENKISTIINGSGLDNTRDLVTIEADNVDMSGFTVTNAGLIGINVADSQYCEVHKNVVCFSGDRGIVFGSGGNNSAYDNIVYNSSAYGAIEAIWSNNNTIYNNSAYFNQWGIATNHGSYNRIYNNTVHSNRGSGIHMDWSSTGNIVYNSNISLNTNVGISFMNQASENIISNNEITGNNNSGISFYNSSNNNIYENNVANSNVGIYFHTSSNNLIYHNNFEDNAQQVHDISWDDPAYIASISIWDDGYPSGGNYWSDYTDIDQYSGPYQNIAGSDGIWDHPYVIDENNQDNYPVFGRANVDIVLVIDRSGSMAWYGDVIHLSSVTLTPDWSKIDTFDIDSSVTTFDVVLETISEEDEYLRIKSPSGEWYGYGYTSSYFPLDYVHDTYANYAGADYIAIYQSSNVESGTWEVYAYGTSDANYELAVQVPPVRLNAAKDAAKYLLDLMSDGDQLGLVAFGDASLDKQLTLLNTEENRDSLRSAIDSVSIAGGSAIGDGIYVAKEELISERHRFGTIPAMVLFTDGVWFGGSDPIQRANEAKDAGIKIYPIGLGRVDHLLLTEIKDITGGDYLYAPSTSELKSMYQSIIATAKGWSTIMSARETVKQNETNEQEVIIDSTILEASFSVDWTVGDLDLTLIRPDDSLIDPAVAEIDPNIRYAGAATYEIYNVKSPMPGTWTMVVTGMDVPPKGESYSIQVTAQTTVTLTLATDKPSYTYPEPTKIMVTLEDTGNPLTGADVEMIVTRPDASQINITLFDDGLDAHGDINTNDSVYTNYFTQYSKDGSYTLKAIAVGTTLIEETFSREAQKTILVSGVPPDTTPPTTLHDYDDLWCTSDLTITLTAIDEVSGIAETYYSINNGSIETVSEHGQPFITMEGNNNALEYWSVDNAGNEELPHKMLTGIQLDKTPPASSINLDGALGNNAWFVSNVAITLVATDNVAEVDNIEYSFDSTTWTAYVTPLAIADEGYIFVYYKSTDKAGNVETLKTETIKIDKTNPYGSVLINNGDIYATSTSVTLTLTPIDATSGIAEMRFSHDNITWTPWEAYSTSKAWALTTGDDTKTVYVQYMDNAGLISPSYQDNIMLDATKPTANAGIDQYVNEDTLTTFDGSASTDDAGIVNYAWTFTDVTTKTLLGEKPTYTFNTPSVYTITLNVTDAAGNWATDTVSITVRPPQPPPDVINPIAKAGADQLVVENQIVSFDGGGSSDNIGIVEYDWNFGDGATGTGKTASHKYTEPGNYTVTLTVRDAAANSNTDSIGVTVQIDADGDGIPDKIDTDKDGVSDDKDVFPLDPTETVDTDGDGIGNNADTDDDNDGFPDVRDVFPLDPEKPLDTDGDGMPNDWENEHGFDPLDAQDASLDADNDGVINLTEYQLNTNPNDDARTLSVLAVAIAAFVVTTAAALASLTGLGASFDLAIKKLPIAPELKEFLQLYGEKLFEHFKRRGGSPRDFSFNCDYCFWLGESRRLSKLPNRLGTC